MNSTKALLALYLVAGLSACGSEDVTSGGRLGEPSERTAQALASRAIGESGAAVTVLAADTTVAQATDDVAGTDDAVRVIEIRMTDFAFEPDTVEVTPGESVRFVVFNEGLVEHEFRLTSQHEVDEHLMAGHEEGHDDADAVGPLVLVPAGETAELEFQFPEAGDDYSVIACLVPGHYESGMVGKVYFRERNP